jgi:hypothetical protein
MFISLLITVCSAAAGAVEFDRFSLAPEGTPDFEVVDDFNGDGRNDILLCDNRLLSLFLMEPGRIQGKPSRSILVPEDAVFFDVGDLNLDGKREVILLDREGVKLFDADDDGGHATTVIESENAFLPQPVQHLAFLDFMRDLNGDGREDVILPRLDRYIIHEWVERRSFRKWGEIPFSANTDFYTERLSQTGSLKEVVHLPQLFVGEDDRGRIAVLFNGSLITAFREGDRGGFETSAKRSVYRPDSREYEEESRAYFGKNLFFENLRDDGSYQLILAENRNGKVRIYSVKDLEGAFRSELTLSTDGWILKPAFVDMNGDGMRDLILPSIEKVGIFTILRVFFTSRFDIHYMIFFNRKEPLFRLAPDLSRSVSLPINITAGPEGVSIRHSLIYSFEGDFNGDGMNDFLSRVGPKKLGVFHGKPGAGFSQVPDLLLEFAPLEDCSSAATKVYDFNDDGVSDLYLYQESLDKGTAKYDVFLSRP